MKKLLIALWLAALSGSAQAQTFKEWFRQNSTQREYLKEQIAQLTLHLELTKEGYKIAKQGLGVIYQIKNREFKLHQNRFDSLRVVKSQITSLSRLQQITDLHGSINQVCEQLPAQITACQWLAADQKKQMISGLQTLYDDCQLLVGAFLMVIRNQQLAMTDDERIQRLEALHSRFQANYLFAQSFRRDLGLVCKSAHEELDAIEYRRTLQDIK